MVWQTKREQIGGNRNMLGCTYILLPGLEVTFSKSNMAKKKKEIQAADSTCQSSLNLPTPPFILQQDHSLPTARTPIKLYDML